MQGLSRREFLRLVGMGMAGLALGGCQAADKYEQSLPAVDELMEALREHMKVPGIAVGLIREGKLFYARGFGVRNVDTGEPMTERSVMEMASISKSFTAAAVMQLVEAGKVGLDDSYAQHVPYFEMADPRYKEITLRHLLSHTSGLPALSESDFFREWEDPWTDDGAAERLVRSLKEAKLPVKPGSGMFMYSDIGYDILAALIQEVSGETFEAYEKRHIFKPLGMNASTFLMSEVKPEDLVAAHIMGTQDVPVVVEQFPYARQHAPSSCLFTTVVDMSHWIMAAIAGGAYGGKRILKPESQDWLWQPLVNDILEVPGLGYNSGWFIQNIDGPDGKPKRLIHTSGGQPGVETSVSSLPDQGLASIVFFNRRDAPGVGSAAGEIAEVLVKQMLRGEL